MQITLDIPEELLSQLSAIEQQIPEALKLGLQAIAARPQKGFAGFAEVVEFLANLPTAEEILASAIGKAPIAKSYPSRTGTLATI
jgi:hypothetical protein